MRLVPSSFDPNDPQLHGIVTEGRWECARALASLKTRFLLSRLPLFWQIEMALNDACRPLGITVLHNDEDNMPVGLCAVRDIPIDTVLTTTEDASLFARYLLGRNVRLPSAWFLISALSERPIPSVLKDMHVINEVHEYPGAPHSGTGLWT